MQTFTRFIRNSAGKSLKDSCQLQNASNRNFSVVISPNDARKYITNEKPIVLHSTSLEKDQKKSIYAVDRLPGARLFDIDLIADKGSDIPRMLPQLGEFADHMKSLGINANDQVVAYDDNGITGGTRALWMLNVYGNDNVKVLDGGLNLWKEKRKPTENGEETWVDTYHRGGEGFEFKRDLIASIQEIKDFAYGNLPDYELVDARNPKKFRGETPGGGHIPHSKNVYYRLLLEENFTFKKPEEIEKAFTDQGVNLSKSIICTCTSGMTATVLYTALRLIGKKDVAVYDGAWLEWSKFPENEIARISDTLDPNNLHSV